jgi:hypothetical protein
MPKEILDSVDETQEIEATTETPSAIVAWFSTGMSIVRFPKPSCCPTWAVMASAIRRIFKLSVCAGIIFPDVHTHDMSRT